MKTQSTDKTRRRFLSTLGAAGAVLSLEELGFLRCLPPVSAEETKLPAGAVTYAPDIEPLVRLLEETPREKVIETFAAKIRSGTGYREVLAALLLAGVRNIQPRPSVGFKFHAVLVVNSAHLASQAAPATDRWLPIFWALDNFKSSQAKDVQEGDWTMAAVNESKVPSPSEARKAFRTAMDAWDVEAADVAVVGLCRSVGATEVFDLLAHYGCRDYRSIGHKAIFVANSWRALQCIGWRYAEPVLRSLTYAMLNHHGEANPATSNLTPDAAWRVTQLQVPKIGETWNRGRLDSGATLAHLDALRTATPEQAVTATAQLIAEGIALQSISDALYLSAAETLMQQRGIIALHSVTTTNAMQFAYRTAFSPSTRLELLLQNAAFIPHFRQSMKSRGKVGTARIDSDRDAAGTDSPGDLESIFATISQNRGEASQKILSFLNSGGRADSLINSARRLVFLKGNDSHDYKFSSAVLEDYFAVSPEFRNDYLAASAHMLPGSGDRDNGLVKQVKQALS